MVPVFILPGCVPAEGDRGPAPPSGPLHCLRPGVLLHLQGLLAPWTGLPGQPTYIRLPPWRDQVGSTPSSSSTCQPSSSSLISSPLVNEGITDNNSGNYCAWCLYFWLRTYSEGCWFKSQRGPCFSDVYLHIFCADSQSEKVRIYSAQITFQED